MNKARGLLKLTESSPLSQIIPLLTPAPGELVARKRQALETFWDGLEVPVELERRIEARAGGKVAMGSDACQAALRSFGDIKRISVITPYMPL